MKGVYSVLAAGLLAAGLLVLGAGCPCDEPARGRAALRAGGSASGTAAGTVVWRRRFRLPQHRPGPPRPTTPQRIARARAQARQLTVTLLRSRIARREVASVADIHGSRLYSRRRYAEALAWYVVGIGTDASFEPLLYNAARAAALSGNTAAARRYLAALRKLATPMARERLRYAPRDPDLAALR